MVAVSMGKWKDTLFPVPAATRPLRILAGITNFIIPGFGLLILSLGEKPFVVIRAIVALCQFCTAIVGIGIVWAWVNAIIILYTGGTNSDGKNVLPMDSDTDSNAVSPEKVEMNVDTL